MGKSSSKRHRPVNGDMITKDHSHNPMYLCADCGTLCYGTWCRTCSFKHKGREREAAKLAGHHTYTTGKPCKNGHLFERWTNSGHCSECDRVNARRYYARRTPSQQRRQQLNVRKFNSGMTPEQYDMLLIAQAGLCDLCGGQFRNTTHEPQADHCHKSGTVRGLLCHACNRRLAIVEDRQWLEKAEHYLDRFAISGR